MSMPPVSNTKETAQQSTRDAQSAVKSWSDDELLDNIADIINENFVMEVEASLPVRS